MGKKSGKDVDTETLNVTHVKRSLSATELNGIGLKLKWNGLLQPFMNALNQISTGNVLH